MDAIKRDDNGYSDKEDVASDSSSSYDEAIECRPLITQPDDFNTNQTETIRILLCAINDLCKPPAFFNFMLSCICY